MSTAQPPHHEEDSLQAPHADSQQADLIRSRDRVSGEKKAWAKKARRRHSVTTAKFTSHDTGKADTTSVTQTLEVETHDVQLDLLADKQTEEVLDALTSEEAAADNTTPEEEIVEELEVAEEQPEEDSNEEADQELVDRGEEPESDTAEEDVEDLGEYVDELSQELDAIEGFEVVEEEPENEPPAEPLLVDDSPENEQAGEIVEELEIKRERISHRQADLQARSWDASAISLATSVSATSSITARSWIAKRLFFSINFKISSLNSVFILFPPFFSLKIICDYFQNIFYITRPV